MSLVNELVKNRDKEAIYWSKKFSAVVGELEQVNFLTKLLHEYSLVPRLHAEQVYLGFEATYNSQT